MDDFIGVYPDNDLTIEETLRIIDNLEGPEYDPWPDVDDYDIDEGYYGYEDE